MISKSRSDPAHCNQKAGNLREQRTSASSKLRFTHDAWNRLVKVEHINETTFPETVSTRGEYEYNGLFQRVIKRSDKDITDHTLGLDEQRLLYYSGAWQVVEERIYDGWTAQNPGNVDRHVQHVWGLRYIDDLVLNRQDSNADGDYSGGGDFTHYAFTDHQFSVVALIDSAGNLIERISYTPYGEARHHWKQDVDGDGDIDATDQSLVHAALTKRIYESGYNVDADFNRDGIIDSNDSRQIGSGAFKGALPAGWISSLTTGNVIGFSGYVFNREIDAGGLYTVRFRHYDPVWGRWISRDRAGYADTMSLYAYGFGYPVDGFDPLGLDWLDNLSNWGAGVGDTLTFGLTKKIRQALGYDDVVDYDSTAYAVGEWTGVAVGFIGGVGAVKGTLIAVGKAIKHGGQLLKFGLVALEGGGSIPVLISANGTAIALTVEALVAAGYTYAQAEQIIQLYYASEGGAGGAKLTKDLKKLSNDDVKTLDKSGNHPHKLKDNSKQDLYKDKNGDVYVGNQDGTGFAEPTGINLNCP